MTIDRAIEILNPEHREVYNGLDEVNEACRIGMEALKRQRWIPCSERLPKQFEDVLVFDALNNTVFTVYYYKHDGWYNGWDVEGITHWMPLPEPPKENV